MAARKLAPVMPETEAVVPGLSYDGSHDPNSANPRSPDDPASSVDFLRVARAALGKDGFTAYLRGEIMRASWLISQCPDGQPDSFGVEQSARIMYLAEMLAGVLAE